MADYIPPVDDMTFLLDEVFDFDAQMAALPGCEEVDTELATSVLEEGGKFCAEVLEPLNRPGDEEGCRLENGVVTTPKGFADAYKAFVEAGWGGLSGIRNSAARACRACCRSCSTKCSRRPTFPLACSRASPAARSRRLPTTAATN